VLNGLVEYALPSALFLFFSASIRASSIYMVGLRLPVRVWRTVAFCVLSLVLFLVFLAYTLNALVQIGVYGPHRKYGVEEDYQSYDDLGNVTAAGAPAPAPAPLPAPNDLQLR
jgi:hypothetical protein